MEAAGAEARGLGDDRPGLGERHPPADVGAPAPADRIPQSIGAGTMLPFREDSRGVIPTWVRPDSVVSSGPSGTAVNFGELRVAFD